MQEQILIAALVVLTAACAKDPSESAPKATVTEPAPKTPAAPAGEEKAAPATPEKPEKPTAADAPAAPVKGPKIAVEPKPITPGHVILGGRVGFVGAKVGGAVGFPR